MRAAIESVVIGSVGAVPAAVVSDVARSIGLESPAQLALGAVSIAFAWFCVRILQGVTRDMMASQKEVSASMRDVTDALKELTREMVELKRLQEPSRTLTAPIPSVRYREGRSGG